MIRIIAVGKVREPGMRELIAEYAKRISAYDRLQIEEAAEEKIPEQNSPAQNEKAKQLEGQRLLARIGKDDYVVLLDLRGKMLGSAALSERIDRLRTQGYSTLDFVIGGSLGTSEAVARRADFRWQLSELTFPHQLARLIVLEQIYRSFRILRHEPYHK